MKPLLPAVVAALLALTGCGGAGDLLLAAAQNELFFDDDKGEPDRSVTNDPGISRGGTWAYASNSPLHIYYDADSGRSVGLIADDLALAGKRQLGEIGSHGSATLRYGRVRDGIGASELIEYLQRDVVQVEGGDVLLRWSRTPPRVHLVEGTSRAMVEETKKAIVLINGALPPNWQLRFSTTPITKAQESAGIDGGITVQFSPRYSWPDSISESADGVAFTRRTGAGVITQAAILVNSSLRNTGRLGVLAHELLHTLGRKHADPDRFPLTIMHAYGIEDLPDFVLRPLDREALHAVYARMSSGTQPGNIAEDLGPWGDVSTHVYGVIGESKAPGQVVFGAGVLNGHVRSYAVGLDLPSRSLRNSPLQGSGTWSGRLIGLTPSARVVAGDADLTVRLATLDGNIDFTNLEAWAAGAAPGALGTGSRWGDGDLGYTVTVFQNQFVQTGGDAGAVTGAFFGPNHESMAGTLKRTDLAAGFGGAR